MFQTVMAAVETLDLNEIIDEAAASGTLRTSDAGLGIAGVSLIIAIVIVAALVILDIIGRWKTVKKLGGRGWSQVIPVYSEWELSSSAGCEMALCIAYTVIDAIVILARIPDAEWIQVIASLCGIAYFVLRCIVMYKVSKRFGKGVGTAIGLVVLPFIFFLILGLGSATAEGDAVEGKRFSA